MILGFRHHLSRPASRASVSSALGSLGVTSGKISAGDGVPHLPVFAKIHLLYPNGRCLIPRMEALLFFPLYYYYRLLYHDDADR
ncbi:hypothetical protein L207DRAFT_510125 [Hyaloscypha variabilis F]|uniref:Uncharacterized protein n=1 Tax=Hyaloscypha variabilis (strain UAMH 11265 / GT02V1 / F) TaxID=1149755 RepID=A0A2J6RYN6_HYAVF|nr:hypothetical protein L207DRAFT_510125 [Hyaloscypha variabilis F]